MARPLKTGLNYFPLDVDFFDDPKLLAVAVEHGPLGQAAAVVLLCAIYRNGYYLSWTPETIVTVARQLPGINILKIKEIVSTLVAWDFFDKTLFQQEHVLTSRGIQQRFATAARRRKTHAASPKLPYWLPEKELAATPPASDRVPDGGTGSEDDATSPCGQTATQTAFMSARTQKMPTEMPQEINREIIKNYPNTPSTPARTREAVEEMKQNTAWTEAMCMRHHLTRDELTQRLDEFALDCDCRGKPTHESLSDTQSHFCNWLLVWQRQQHKQQPSSTPNNTYSHANHQHCTSANYIQDAQQWAIEQSLQFLRTPNKGSQAVSAIFPF